MHGLAVALFTAAVLAQVEGKPAEAERLASEVIELSTRQNFAQWLAAGVMLRGWARSVLGNTTRRNRVHRGRNRRLSGHGRDTRFSAYYLFLKAQALYLANRTPEALETIKEADALTEKYEEYHMRSGLYWLRAVFLAAMGAEEAQKNPASFREAIRFAKEMKSVSSERGAEQSTRNIGDKKRARQQDMHFDYLFGNSFRVGPPRKSTILSREAKEIRTTFDDLQTLCALSAMREE